MGRAAAAGRSAVRSGAAPAHPPTEAPSLLSCIAQAHTVIDALVLILPDQSQLAPLLVGGARRVPPNCSRPHQRC